MSNRKLIVLIALLVIMVGYVFITFFEYYEEDKDIGWSKKARLNPYLAAHLYLEKKNHDVFSTDSYEKLPALDQVDTLFISDSGYILSDRRLTSVTSWVEEGGHLIIASRRPGDNAADRILRYYGAYSYTISSDTDTDSAIDPDNVTADEVGELLREYNAELAEEAKLETITDEIEYAESKVDAAMLTPLKMRAVEEPMRIYFNTQTRIWHDSLNEENGESETTLYTYQPYFWQGDENGAHFMQIDSGEGLVTLISDPLIFSSSQIGLFDHAFLWEYFAGSPEKIVLLYGTNMPSLWSLLKLNAPELMLSTTLLIALWLYYRIPRTGPIISKRKQTRRSVSEHIFASAIFLWRNNHQAKLLNSLREDIAMDIARKLPQYRVLNTEGKTRILAEITRLDGKAIRRSLAHRGNLSKSEFVTTVKTLQKIKENL